MRRKHNHASLGDLQTLLHRGFRYALALTHDRAEADDVVQDAWVAVLNAGQPRSPGVLFRAIRSRFIDRYRRKRLVSISSLETHPGNHIDPNSNADIAGMIAYDEIEHALGSVRAEERELLFLHAVEGYTADEIGALTDRTSGAVRVLLYRVRQKLQVALRKQERQAVSA